MQHAAGLDCVLFALAKHMVVEEQMVVVCVCVIISGRSPGKRQHDTSADCDRGAALAQYQVLHGVDQRTP